MAMFGSRDDALLAAIDRTMARVEFDLDGTVTDANALFLDLLGYTLDEVRGQHHRVFVPEDDRAGQDYAAFWDRLRAGQHEARAFRRVAKSGEVVWIQGSYNPILDRRGRPTKVVKLATDITEPLENARRARKAEAELHHALIQTIEVLVAASEKRDPYTAGHSERVSVLSVATARALGLPDDQIEVI